MEAEELFNEKRGAEEQPKKESPLVSLERDLKFFNESIREVAVEIMVEGLSLHPIFIAHQHEIKLGELILDRIELNTEWSIHASTIEEFTERGIIKAEPEATVLAAAAISRSDNLIGRCVLRQATDADVATDALPWIRRKATIRTWETTSPVRRVIEAGCVW